MRIDSITAIVLLAFAAGAYLISFDFPEGANTFPQLLASATGFFAILVLIMDLRRARSEATPKISSKGSTTKAYATYLLAVLYVFGIQIIGFFVSSVLVSIILMAYMGVRKISTYAISLICMMLFYFVLFDRFLHVPLPHGMLY